MASTTIYTTAEDARDKVRTMVARLPVMLGGGDGGNGARIARGLKLRVAVAFLEMVKIAFLIKARGGTDDAGISWPPLSKEYLAYGRGPFSTRKAGGSAPGRVKGGDRNGQQKDGFMTPSELQEWRKIFAGSLARYRVMVGENEARNASAAIAWAEMKKRGVRTKLDVFGNRTVDILRDRGILFDSLSPGTLTTNPDGSAEYNKPPSLLYDQIMEDSPGKIVVGTNVPYATYHQNAKKTSRLRKLWPDNGLPHSWTDYMAEQLRHGIQQALTSILRRAT